MLWRNCKQTDPFATMFFFIQDSFGFPKAIWSVVPWFSTNGVQFHSSQLELEKGRMVCFILKRICQGGGKQKARQPNVSTLIITRLFYTTSLGSACEMSLVFETHSPSLQLKPTGWFAIVEFLSPGKTLKNNSKDHDDPFQKSFVLIFFMKEMIDWNLTWTVLKNQF